MKPIEPIEISIGTTIQDPRSKIPREDRAPIEISIGLIGFNRHTDVESVWMCLNDLTVYACVCMDDHVDMLVVCMPIETD